MSDLYLEILSAARLSVVWEIVFVSLLFFGVGLAVAFLPFEIKRKNGETRRLFRLREKWQMWVLKTVLWALILGGGLWFGFARGDVISAIDADIATGAVTEISTEYVVEKAPFSLGNRRIVWVHDGKSAFSLTQYGTENFEGVYVGTVIYATQSKIVVGYIKG